VFLKIFNMKTQLVIPKLEDEIPKNFYNISTEDILKKYVANDIYERAAVDLILLVRNGTIWFPFQRYFRGNPDELFTNLKRTNLQIQKVGYRLRSYYPKYGSFLPPKFRGIPITIAGTRGIYETADVLSDHYIEDIRLKAKRYDQKQSVLEWWIEDSCLKEILKMVLHKSYITPESLRDAIYETIPETKIFNPSWAIALLKLIMGPQLTGKKWLDISAGWGDRLIAAMALDMEYVGFDPNIELRKGHNEMIKQFGDPQKHRVIYEPFEKATIPNGPYDVVLSSPPYFTVEEYVPGQEGQSIVSYPDFNEWMVKFLFASLNKAWNNLKEGGYLILHLGDAKTIITSEATNIYIENYLPGASWEGVIGLQGEAGYPRPVWVWKKVSRMVQRNIWEPQQERSIIPGQKGPLKSTHRTLYYTYPSLYYELLKFFASNYAPYYPIRKTSAKAVKDHIVITYPTISSQIIDSLLDDLMISSVLETQGAEGTINFLTNLMKKFPDLSRSTIDSEASVKAPYYPIRQENIIRIRDLIATQLPMVERKIIDTILHDNLMISSLLETIGTEGTIIWSVAMLKLALRV